jgi:LTXXQ motif family protein
VLRIGILRALLALVLGCVLASSADARKWRRTISPEGVEVHARASSGAFGTVIEELVRGCAQRGTELVSWPFDDIARIADPNELQRRALQALRDAAKEAAERLASDCPQQVPAAPSARLEAVEQGIDIALAAFATLQPAMQAFYGALDDEQKARLQRDMTMSAAPAPSAERSRERADQRSDQRREPRRGATRGTKPDDRLSGAGRIAAPKLGVGACEGFAAALRGWPIREIERSVQLSEQQRVAFYEFVTASLKAANTLVTACPAATAITPARRMEVMVARLAAVRAAIAAIQPALTRFYEALDQGQKMRFAGMS